MHCCWVRYWYSLITPETPPRSGTQGERTSGDPFFFSSRRLSITGQLNLLLLPLGLVLGLSPTTRFFYVMDHVLAGQWSWIFIGHFMDFTQNHFIV